MSIEDILGQSIVIVNNILTAGFRVKVVIAGVDVSAKNLQIIRRYCHTGTAPASIHFVASPVKQLFLCFVVIFCDIKKLSIIL